MAKKASASQSRGGSTRKKTSRSRATGAKKKAGARKGASAKKKNATKKKTSSKKTTRKKSAAKKAASGKSTPKKKTETRASSKKSTRNKVVSKKKTSVKKAPPARKTGAGGKPGANGDVKSSKRGNVEKKPVATLGAAQEAARKLAAAAGLVPLSQRSSQAEEKASKARRVRRSPLKPAQLEEFRLILLQKRSEVLGDVTEMENEALGGRSGSLSSFPQHLADQGSDEYDQSLALGLAASQRKLLAEIDAALDRIENGTFGICEVLGTSISRQRLDAQPWTRVSLEGARQLDSYTSR